MSMGTSCPTGTGSFNLSSTNSRITGFLSRVRRTIGAVSYLIGALFSGNRTWILSGTRRLDHWVHATSYWRIGMDRFGKGSGKIIGSADITKGIREGAEFSLDGKTIKTYIGKPKPMPGIWNREYD
jgi:hypothetical protein